MADPGEAMKIVEAAIREAITTGRRARVHAESVNEYRIVAALLGAMSGTWYCDDEITPDAVIPRMNATGFGVDNDMWEVTVTGPRRPH